MTEREDVYQDELLKTNVDDDDDDLLHIINKSEARTVN